MTHCVRGTIYEKRPQFCRDYPTKDDMMPAACTYRFLNGERSGTCQPEVCQENACCNWPREGGEPEGVPRSELEGGSPCKHMEWVEVEAEKKADDAATSDPSEFYDIIKQQLRPEGF